LVTQRVIVHVITWMPTPPTATGLPQGQAGASPAIFSVGGIAGSLLPARLIDRRKSRRSLARAYLVAALTIALIGFPTVSTGLMFAVVCLARARHQRAA
jgi:cyanate permease